MTKNVNALAALASVSAFAQSSVTLSGDVGFGVQSGLVSSNKKSGMDQTTGNIKLTVTEDLGGGMKATAATQFDVRGRTSNNAEETTLGLSGGFGSITIGAVEAGNGIIGRAWAGAPISLANGFDNGALLGGVANTDIVTYSAPAVNGVVVSVKRLDSIGLGTDVGGANGAWQANVLDVSYSGNGLNAGIDYTKNYGTSTLSRVRISGNYDLGMAVVGYGTEKTQNADRMNTVGVKVPMGALTLGVVYAKRAAQKGTAVGANYALSKRTSINFSTGNINDAALSAYNDLSTTTDDYTQKSQSRLALVHTF